QYIYAFLTIIFVGIVGFVDDFTRKKIKKRSKNLRNQLLKVILIALCALPLMLTRTGSPYLTIPFIGTVYFGTVYWFLLIPIGITGAANLVNMLAGLNGLEIGISLIVCIFLLLVSIFLIAFDSSYILAALIGCLAAFLIYNIYPAKVFPGDVGTLCMGATIAAAVIVGNYELIGVIILIPHIIEFVISVRVKLNSENFGIPQQDGTLNPMKPKQALTHYFMTLGNFSESTITYLIWIFCAFWGLFALYIGWPFYKWDLIPYSSLNINNLSGIILGMIILTLIGIFCRKKLSEVLSSAS
ncbi:MAG: hypothetical protein KAI34_08025, partial [Candidatus Lokiarchaeota archaeon]|nr:hypothetical protein [Candidatus Lokiarchaeota archaeon]